MEAKQAIGRSLLSLSLAGAAFGTSGCQSRVEVVEPNLKEILPRTEREVARTTWGFYRGDEVEGDITYLKINGVDGTMHSVPVLTATRNQLELKENDKIHLNVYKVTEWSVEHREETYVESVNGEPHSSFPTLQKNFKIGEQE